MSDARRRTVVRCSAGLLAAGSLLLSSGCVTRPERVLSPAEIQFLASVSGRQMHEGDSPLEQMDAGEARKILEQVCQSEVSFHGRVVDETGAPLRDAEIQMLVLDRPLERIEFPYLTGPVVSLTTGGDGKFELKPRPGAGVLVDVRKDGYQPVESARQFFRFSPLMSTYDRERLPTADKPAVFMLTALNPDDVVEFVSGALRLPDDGSPVEMGIRRYTPFGADPGAGDLRVQVTTSPPGANDHYDWTVRVTVPGGGLQEYQDILMTVAPEAGYAEEVDFEMSADDPKWSSRRELQLILHLRDGTYATALLRVRTQGDRFVSADGTWNRAGGRYLY